MAVPTKLRDEPIGPGAVHLCVDMQRMYAGGTPWAFAWMPRVLPGVVALAEREPGRTVFTRFIPARRPGDGHGVWRLYYRHWAAMTIEAMGADGVELVPELGRFAPPAEVIDKPVYSPWLGSDLNRRLRARAVDTLIVTGGETDMCVLATLLGAVDHGYRTIVVQDAVCSTSDAAHDAMLALFSERFGVQIEVAAVEEILDRWPAAG
jgi:nicotinamidase-related amidase